MEAHTIAAGWLTLRPEATIASGSSTAASGSTPGSAPCSAPNSPACPD